MFDPSPAHLLITLVVVLISVGIPAAILYWVVRLAVRHGRRDASRRR